MATLTLTAAMPAMELVQGEVLKLEAIDPTTGAAVAGVVVDNFVIYATDRNSSVLDDQTPLRGIYLAQSDANIDPANFGGPAG